MANRRGQGRRPLPTALKVARGTVQKCRLNPHEPQPATDNVLAPAGMSPGAEQCWQRIVSQLKAAQVVSNLDVFALRVLCETYAQWVDTHNKAAKIGPIVKDPKGRAVANPYFLAADKLGTRLFALMTEFGMTPSSRD